MLLEHYEGGWLLKILIWMGIYRLMKLHDRCLLFPSKDIFYWAAFRPIEVSVGCKIASSRERYSKSQRILQNMTVGAVWALRRVQDSSIACVMTISALTITCVMAQSRGWWICQEFACLLELWSRAWCVHHVRDLAEPITFCTKLQMLWNFYGDFFRPFLMLCKKFSSKRCHLEGLKNHVILVCKILNHFHSNSHFSQHMKAFDVIQIGDATRLTGLQFHEVSCQNSI